MEEVKFDQAKIEVKGNKYFVTHIPTATSGMWFTIHDLFDVWAAVSIDLDGTVVGWRNPPDEETQALFEKAIKEAWDIPGSSTK